MVDYKKDFPIFLNHKIAYLDNAATTQKPACVLYRQNKYYEYANANPLRGVYVLSDIATIAYETARDVVASFIGAKHSKQIVFTRNTTESINLVAYAWALDNIKPDDEILVSITAHHSNLLPWQMVAQRTGAKLKFVCCNPDGTYSQNDVLRAVTPKTKLAAVQMVSNVTGVRFPYEHLIAAVHKNGGYVLLDAAQAVAHMPIDVKETDCDFLCFSGHKMYATMGIGVLYAKMKILKGMQPFLRGGEMIQGVGRYKATWADIPQRFQAGTVNVGGAISLRAAIEYIRGNDFECIVQREKRLTKQLMSELDKLGNVKMLNNANDLTSGIVSFNIDGMHSTDVAIALSDDLVCVRSGHHCAQPLMKHLGADSFVRASLSFYNDDEDIDRLINALRCLNERIK